MFDSVSIAKQAQMGQFLKTYYRTRTNSARIYRKAREVVAAVRSFQRFQITEHKTGDPWR
jgi:hypothetical protein